MSDAIYFQWQNDCLLQTIYPLREGKLRDFLTYIYEIEIWKKYKDKKPEDIRDEVEAYRKAQREKLVEALDRYEKMLDYFLTEDVEKECYGDFAVLDQEVMHKIKEMHKLFIKWFPTYNNLKKEKYFLSERVRQFEDLRKQNQHQLSEKERILRNMSKTPTWGKRDDYLKDIDRLRNITPKMVAIELNQLYRFLAAFVRRENYKQELVDQKLANEKARLQSMRILAKARADLEAAQARLVDADRILRRYRNLPDLETLKAPFFKKDGAQAYRIRYPDLDAELASKINAVRQHFILSFDALNNPAREKLFLGERLRELDDFRKKKLVELADIQRDLQNMEPTWTHRAAREKTVERLKNVTLKVLEEEVSQLADLQWAYDRQGKTPAEIAALIQAKEKERAVNEGQVRTLSDDIRKQEGILKRLEGTSRLPDNDQMLAMIDVADITVKDVVNGKAEDYRSQLSLKNHDQLLEDVVRQFLAEPDRYPLWLQYMVIHFSGMRYRSAHGSWADPKDMLLSLRIKAVNDELKRGDDIVRALSEDKYKCYQLLFSQDKSAVETDGVGCQQPKLASTTDRQWKSKIENHLKNLAPSKTYGKRKTYFDLRLDEENYEIDQMTDEQALEELEAMKGTLPDWMWKEIVQLTDLRKKEVKSADWEQLTQDEIEERNLPKMGVYREIMNKWKSEHLTGWREEHERGNRLIVTRAVCNEVAEHIQHLRGHKPAGGLTAKPEWYLRKDKDPVLSQAVNKPYFTKAKAEGDFKVGASILWLRWVNSEPNMWRITRPLTLKNGEGLLPREVDVNGWANSWSSNAGSSFTRQATVVERDQRGNRVERTEGQWLRWMHEATVAEVAETAQGTVVLTFETALPYEDKRQSTIGVFKRMASDLKYSVSHSSMNGTFVGYVPEGEIPYADLKDMLDWNKILRRNVVSPAEMQAYWQKAARRSFDQISFSLPQSEPLLPFEVAPALKQKDHEDWIVSYEVDPFKKSASVYQPVVTLKRGTRLEVSREKAVQIGLETYYRVAQSDSEPRAQDLYVRAAELIAAPAESSSMPAQALRNAGLSKLSSADPKLKPVFAPAAVQLAAGTKFRVSQVHKLSPADKGDGAVQAGNAQVYYLVVACPANSAAQGLFIRKEDLKAISEVEYSS